MPLVAFDPKKFDGLDFDRVDNYRDELFKKLERLRIARAFSRVLGAALTFDLLEQGRVVLGRIDARNQTPRLPRLFAYLLLRPELFDVVDLVLERATMSMKTTQVHEVFRRLRDSPDSVLPELAVYECCRRDGLSVEWFPKVALTGKEADLAVTVFGRRVFLEVTVLNQGTFWDHVDESVELSESGVWSGAGPGISKDANRVSRKIAEELRQTAPGEANVLLVVFAAVFPTKIARPIGFNDALEGPPFVFLPSGSLLDFSPRTHLDSAIEFDATMLRAVYISPECYSSSRLSDDERFKLVSALRRLPFIFP